MKRLIPLFLFLAIGTVASYLFFQDRGEDPSRIRLSGNLEITEINVAPKSAGRVLEVLAREGDTVKKDQIVARMELKIQELSKERDEAGVIAALSALAQLRIDTERTRDVLDRELAMRRAEIAQAEAQVRDLEAGSRPQEIAQAQAALDDARSQLSQAQADFDRAHRLFQNEDISRAAHDQAQTRLRSLTAAHAAAQQRFALVKEGPRPESIALARAALTRARAALQLTEANRKELQRKEQEATLRQADVDRARAQASIASTQLSDTEIRAAIDGVVLARPTEPGEVVNAGTTVVTLGDIERPWLRGYIPETQLGRIKIGQKARLRTDSFPGRDFNGTITFIASEAEFTPKQIQTPEERVKLVYRIKIEVANPAGELKNNMPMDAEILTQ